MREVEAIMNRREFLKNFVAVAAGNVVLSNSALEARISASRPNIILIMADDLGYECLGSYGSISYKTPVLDKLAGNGLRFEHCYSQPLCTPSRVKIMTGRSNGRNYIKWGVFPFEETTFAHVMKAAGYDTCIVGKWQLKGRRTEGPRVAGFDEYCLWHMTDIAARSKGSRYRKPQIIQNGEWLHNLKDKYGPDVFRDYILDFIERHRSSTSKPFFVYYPMVLTHKPFVPTPESSEWGQAVKGKKYFRHMVTYMDKTIGHIVSKLDTLRLRENTLLLFTADNGTPRDIVSKMQDGSSIQGGKESTTDAGTHVPLIANWKGVTPVKVSPDLVDFSDFLPTIADAAGAFLPRNLEIDGRSFLPQLRGEKGNPRDWIFCWYEPRINLDGPWKRFARDRRWKLYGDGNYRRAGKLFDVPADPPEKRPIEPGQGGLEAADARARLQAVLDFMPQNVTY